MVGELLLDLVGDVLVHLALDIAEGGVGGEVAHVVGGHASQVLGEHLRHGGGVLHDLGVCVDGLAVHAHGEDLAVAVVDGAAAGGQSDNVGAAALRLGGKARTVNHLEPEEAQGDGRDDDAEKAQQHLAAGVEVSGTLPTRPTAPGAVRDARGLVIRGPRRLMPHAAALSVSAPCHGERVYATPWTEASSDADCAASPSA